MVRVQITILTFNAAICVVAPLCETQGHWDHVHPRCMIRTQEVLTGPETLPCVVSLSQHCGGPLCQPSGQYDIFILFLPHLVNAFIQSDLQLKKDTTETT